MNQCKPSKNLIMESGKIVRSKMRKVSTILYDYILILIGKGNVNRIRMAY